MAVQVENIVKPGREADWTFSMLGAIKNAGTICTTVKKFECDSQICNL